MRLVRGFALLFTPIDQIDHEVCVHHLDGALVEYVQPASSPARLVLMTGAAG
jgi:hypothetical protein